MKLIINILFIFLPMLVLSQQSVEKEMQEKKHIQEGVEKFESAEFLTGEKDFRKALAKNPVSDIAAYDLGRNHLEQSKSLEAAYNFEKAAENSNDKLLKSKAWYNAGNIWFHKKKYQKAVEAYKNSLRNNPEDEEARYNLALAKKMLKKQQKQNKKNKKKQQNKQKQQNKNNKQKDNKNGKDKKNNKQNDKKENKGKNDKQKDGKKNQKSKNEKGKDDKKERSDKDKQRDKQNREGDKQEKKPNRSKSGNQNKLRKSKLSPQQVKQLLIGLKNKEMKTQKKIKAKAISTKKKKQEKDW